MSKLERGLFGLFLGLMSLTLNSQSMAIEIVSLSSNGEQANRGITEARISGNGQFVVFASFADNLVPSDTNTTKNGGQDIFVHDRVTGSTERVNVSSSGEQAIALTISGYVYSRFPSISADGRFVSFSSNATKLVPLDTNNDSDGFLHDRVTGLTERVTVSSSGEQAINQNTIVYTNVNDDGQFVAFSSRANNLVLPDLYPTDIYVRNRVDSLTERVSISSSGHQGSHSGGPVISSDGRFIAFSSRAHLDPPDTNNKDDIFIRDRNLNITERISLSSSGEEGNDNSSMSDLTADGRYVLFTSAANNLVVQDTNDVIDLFVHDRVTRVNERVNVSSSGEQAIADPSPYYSGSFVGSIYGASISEDGRFIAFVSDASNLVANDTNNSLDVFIHDRETRVTQRISISSAGEQVNSDSLYPSISADGRSVSFVSASSNLVPGDINGVSDVFVVDNPLFTSTNDSVKVEKIINNSTRSSADSAARLSAGTLYKQFYKVANNSSNRLYQVKVYEGGNLVCNFYSLNPDETKERCISFKTVLQGDQHTSVNLRAKVTGSNQEVVTSTDAYYTGLNGGGELVVTHRINNVNADTADQAPTLNTQPASVLFKVENTGDIELYQIKTYHDPVSPVNSGWDLQCVLGPMKPGQVRYCKKDLTLNDSGLNQSVGRVQGRNAIRSATEVINASNPTYFMVP